jgi:3-hydroxyacyl-CoA dehydrogenase / enoyl-CoA hydratase / 3-hydroxybutyryl-CoA epimerase
MSTVSATSADQPPTALRVQIAADGVAVVTLDVPGKSVNALSMGLNAEFEERFAELTHSSVVRAVVLISGKPDSFVVGADIEMLAGAQTAAAASELSRRGQRALARVEAAPVPVVCAIHGACLGGGLELALACTARVVTDSPRSVLGQPEVLLGLIPGAGGTQRLPRLVGIATALDLVLTGRSVEPEAAARLGLVDEVVPRPLLLGVARRRALELAEAQERGRPLRPEPALGDLTSGSLTATARGWLASFAGEASSSRLRDRVLLEGNPVGRKLLFHQARKKLLAKTRGNYPAPERALEAIRIGVEDGAARGYEAEARLFGELLVGDASRRLVELFSAREALKGCRGPSPSGSRLLNDPGVPGPGVEPRAVERLGVLGGGLMGGGIAYLAAKHGVPVRLEEQDDEGALRGLAAVRGVLDGRVEKRRLAALERDQIMGRITATTTPTGFGRADLVIEAVYEELALKQRVLREIEAVTRPTCAYASNTSAIPIGLIAEAAQRPESVVGMHFFAPVQKRPLLEVVRAPRSAPWAVATAVDFGQRLGKTVIVVGDGVGFYTTRVLAPLVSEAAHLLYEGAAIEAIDGAMMDFGFPMGPLQVLDEVGIDVAQKVGQVMRKAFGERLTPPPGLQAFVDDGRLGRKGGRGFYVYGERPAPDASVYRLTPHGSARLEIPAEEIQERCALALVNEAARCLGEGLLRGARDGDVGAVLGLGFPPFRGGPFRYADSLGAAGVLRRLERYRARHGARFEPAPILVQMARTGERFY